MERSDRDLIESYFEGDFVAFDMLVKRHLPALYTFIRRYCPEPTMADDIAQETFVKVWRHLRKFDRSKNFKTWLFTIGRNTTLDWLRKKKSIAFSSLDTDEHTFADGLVEDGVSAEEHFDTTLSVQELQASMELLGPVDRTVLMLYFQEGLTFQEIASVLGQSLNTVKSRQRRALAKLRGFLAKK